MENSFKSLVDNAASILIVLPASPNFDQVAAGLGLYLALLKSKPLVQITCPTPMVVEFNRLIGVNKISTDYGNKNLLVSFKGYPAVNIEKVSYDIVDGEFRLTVIPKAGFSAPLADQIIIGRTGSTENQAVILIDGASDASFPALSLSDFAKVKIIHIGLQAPNFAKNFEILSFARPASSISELVTLMLKDNGFSLESECATNLLLGLDVATDSFITKTVSADTFQAAADLIKAGAKRQVESMVVPQTPVGNQTSNQQNLQKMLAQMQAAAAGYPPAGYAPVPVSGNVPEPAPTANLSSSDSNLTPVPAAAYPQETTEANPANAVNPPTDWLSTPKIFQGTSVS